LKEARFAVSADSKRHRPGVIRAGRCQGEGSGPPVPPLRPPLIGCSRSTRAHLSAPCETGASAIGKMHFPIRSRATARRSARACPGAHPGRVVTAPTAGHTPIAPHVSARIAGRGARPRGLPRAFGRRLGPSPHPGALDGSGGRGRRPAQRGKTASRVRPKSRGQSGRPQRRIGGQRVRKVPAVAW